ncbi:urokinase plasminogen activator surface receptor-like isoform X2 [Labeo rohita]|uniref:urokinase plasminogen activator surface receptor-like isoform X2 n=1 Tax=Labeo rohita TaxID=84645 RepID=UPI0021E1E070|nr:urokinase plasminogen activator surface receptor-like isoform X2 [Labeo rohita]
MNLQISLFLLIIFFTAGHSLRCYECTDLTGSCEAPKEKTCSNERSSCVSLTAITQIGGNTTKLMFKSCADVCVSVSTNFGVAWVSSVCCNTELCNFQDAPDPNSLAPNGKKCYYCDEKSCSNILRCTGNANYCFNGTGVSDIVEVEKGYCILQRCHINPAQTHLSGSFQKTLNSWFRI